MFSFFIQSFNLALYLGKLKETKRGQISSVEKQSNIIFRFSLATCRLHSGYWLVRAKKGLWSPKSPKVKHLATFTMSCCAKDMFLEAQTHFMFINQFGFPYLNCVAAITHINSCVSCMIFRHIMRHPGYKTATMCPALRKHTASLKLCRALFRK